MAAFFACAAAQAAEPPESQALASALRQLEYGDFETAESALRPIAENGGVALIVGGGLVGVAGLAIGLAGTSGQPTQSLFTKFDDIGTVSLILVQVSIPIAIVGGILLARGSRAQRLR